VKNKITDNTRMLTWLAALMMTLPGALGGQTGHAAVLPPSEQADSAPVIDWGEPNTPAPADEINDPTIPPLVGGYPSAFPMVEAIEPVRSSEMAAPAITMYYGDVQSFGQIGNPQEQANLLGQVSGTAPYTVTYALNGGATQPLSVGPDQFRLPKAGEFNIELPITDLISGTNSVVITATDALAEVMTKTVTVNYTSGNIWPEDYTIDWAGVSNLQDVAQVVDGDWVVDANGLRPLTFRYDRLVGLGDMSWTDYEVTAPFMVHGVDPSGFSGPSNGAGIGLIQRWRGHFPTTPGEQPGRGWRRLGALGWYRWTTTNTVSIELRGNSSIIANNPNKQLNFETQYVMKMSVQSVQSGPSYYRFKIWPADQPEPGQWDVQGQGNVGELSAGSVLLVAHHVDATFGDVTIKPLSSLKPTLAIHTTDGGSVTVIPQQTEYEYGQQVQLQTQPESGYFFDGWSGDLLGAQSPLVFNITKNMVITGSFSMTQTDPISSTVRSDDFNSCAIDPAWSFHSPDPAADFEMTSSQLLINVPGGSEHNIFLNDNRAPRLLQEVPNTDFEIIVKFESTVNQGVQTQGVLIQQDPLHFVRYDFFRNNQGTHVYAASFRGTISGTLQLVNQIDNIVSPGPVNEYYMRIRRVGNIFTQFYSFDGQTWASNGNFTYVMNATQAGVFAGNAGSNPPPFTAIVDYFFNAAAPITPEDGKSTGVAAVVLPGDAAGAIMVSPQKTIYNCTDEITVTAQPAAGWRFVRWEGIVSGSEPTATFDFTPGVTVRAVFEEITNSNLYLPLVTNRR
jgi:hypothetical protein